MDISTRKGIFTRTESSYYLARIFIKHESRYDKASNYLASLINKYPNNPIFLMKYTEALLLLNKYEEAQPYLERLKKRNDKFFPIAWRTFEGLIQEKHLKNDQEAAKLYQIALRQPHDDEYTKEYHVFAYAGLARIANRAGERRKAVGYYKKVEELAEYKAFIQEAKAFLK
jgi:tetratricopeptide (TPR) repeat protein